MSYDPLFDAAQKAVDDVLGKGEYARLNRNNPGVPPALRKPPIIRMIVRGYGAGVKIFEERIEVEEAALEAIAFKQMGRVMQFENHMVEIELLDAPPAERFLRFGTDPSRMVIPIGVKL